MCPLNPWPVLFPQGHECLATRSLQGLPWLDSLFHGGARQASSWNSSMASLLSLDRCSKQSPKSTRASPSPGPAAGTPARCWRLDRNPRPGAASARANPECQGRVSQPHTRHTYRAYISACGLLQQGHLPGEGITIPTDAHGDLGSTRASPSLTVSGTWPAPQNLTFQREPLVCSPSSPHLSASGLPQAPASLDRS